MHSCKKQGKNARFCLYLDEMENKKLKRDCEKYYSTKDSKAMRK